MLAMIEQYGWAIQYVQADRVHPPWAYTVGLVQYDLAELVVTGLSTQRAGHLLNDVAHEVVWHDGECLPGQRFPLDDGTRIEVVELPHPDAHLLAVPGLFPGLPLRALQLVWCDDRGRWPWDRRFRGRRGGQPVLGPRAETGA
ncbi:DUF4262 domain-containing protein [Actinomycetospora sp. OC33-EN08]|uniref:DUF4262 domain-containing protein n=1 Tax=Actinomycetospora aurantiaca TaxID=3129233 RepID=A0ABU8MI34_9PSEU